MSNAYGNARILESFLKIGNFDFTEMEDRSRKARIHLRERFEEHLKVLLLPRPARCPAKGRGGEFDTNIFCEKT